MVRVGMANRAAIPANPNDNFTFLSVPMIAHFIHALSRNADYIRFALSVRAGTQHAARSTQHAARTKKSRANLCRRN
jgi:hypothetical protein